jgi:hypothetical protein
VHHQRGTIAKIETFFENYKKFVKFFMKWPFGCMKLDQITIFESESQKIIKVQARTWQGVGKDFPRSWQAQASYLSLPTACEVLGKGFGSTGSLDKAFGRISVQNRLS